MDDKEFDPLAETGTGLLIAITILVLHLDGAGIISKDDYVDGLNHWLDNQPPEKRQFARYNVLRALIDRLGPRPPVIHWRHLRDRRYISWTCGAKEVGIVALPHPVPGAFRGRNDRAFHCHL